MMATLALAAWAVAPAAAQSVPDPLVGVRIEEALAAGHADEALRLIDEALAGAADPAFIEDLQARKAQILSEAGRHAEAAAALEEQAGSIVDRDGETSPELIPVLEKAAAEHEKAGNVAAAVDAFGYILRILPAAGLDDRAEAYLARLGKLAAAANADVAAQARGLAEDFEANRKAGARAIFESDPANGSTKVRIYYATDRAHTGDDDPSNFYGGDRGGRLEMGTAVVSIPPHHMPGQIERPSVWTLEFREDPGKHVVLQSVTPGDADAVFADMRGQLAAAGSESAFVFVHGFNVPFSEAAQRTAQMAYDMNFDGIPIL
jgi:tetratricopeptide (TPR) repeat protein